jgi:cell division protein FtsL
MVRLNLLLMAVVLACALGVVTAQNKARKLYRELEREQQRTRELDVEWGKLQLEASTWAAHGRIEKIARERLRMAPPAAGQLIAVETPAS